MLKYAHPFHLSPLPLIPRSSHKSRKNGSQTHNIIHHQFTRFIIALSEENSPLRQLSQTTLSQILAYLILVVVIVSAIIVHAPIAVAVLTITKTLDANTGNHNQRKSERAAKIVNL